MHAYYESQLLLSCLVVFDSLRPHELQHSRLSCPSPSPGACSNSYPLTWWCHQTISSSVIPFSSCLQSFPASIFSNELALYIRWSKYWSFSFCLSPSNEYSGLISFRVDWFDLAPRSLSKGLLESSIAPQFKGTSSSAFSLFYCPALTSLHDYWKNHSFDNVYLHRQSYVSAF